MTAANYICFRDKKLNVPSHTIVPYIEGDGIGVDIWPAAQCVFDSAVKEAYNGERSIEWKQVYAGEAAFKRCGQWLPDETLLEFRKCLVGIKGPLTTPVGGGIRSLNVALRQELDLYVCLRPVRWFTGVPSPVHRPELIDMVVFRENSEDIYAGIEFANGTSDCDKFVSLLKDVFPDRFAKVRFPETSGFGIKPVSQDGTKRLVRAAIDYAISHNRNSVTLVHKGNIMKYTEGAFRDWGYAVAKEEFGCEVIGDGPWMSCDIKGDDINCNDGRNRKLIIKDVIADAFLQQILLRPEDYDVIATLNLNGDYLSDALAAQVGGIGIAPGANINYDTGHAVFEATHGTAPKYAGLDKANPSSLILSGEMMLRYLGWDEAADLIIKGVESAIERKQVTYDFARLMPDANCISCRQYAEEVVSGMHNKKPQ